MTSDVALLDSTGNVAVVQVAQRRFPGVLIQGDTLFTILQDVQYAQQMATSGDQDELMITLQMLEEKWSTALNVFEKVCLERNLGLPYKK